jgi:hypothetical protein
VPLRRPAYDTLAKCGLDGARGALSNHDSQPAALAGLADGFRARATVEALEQAGDMHFDRAWAEIQPRSSLLVGQPCDEKVEDFTLAAGRAGALDGCARSERAAGARRGAWLSAWLRGVLAGLQRRRRYNP